MSLLPKAVGRLDTVVEAIRDGDRDRVRSLLLDELERIENKANWLKSEYLNQVKSASDIDSVIFLAANEIETKKWIDLRRACGWSGDESPDLPVEDLPIGGIIFVARKPRRENWEIAEIVDNKCCIISRDGSVSPFWVPVEFLQCVGVRFDLPKG